MRAAAAFLLASILAAGCRTAAPPVPAAPDWPRHMLSSGAGGVPSYSAAIPPDLRRVPVQGIDSEVARFEGGPLRLDFDYGWYGGFDECRGRPGCRQWTERIDGRMWELSLAAPDVDVGGPYRRLLSARVQVDERTSLAVAAACASEADCERGLAVVRGIRFGR